MSVRIIIDVTAGGNVSVAVSGEGTDDDLLVNLIPDQFTLTPIFSSEINTANQSSPVAITGPTEGATLDVTNGQLSNDGTNWSSSVAFEDGNTLLRGVTTSSSSYSTLVTESVTVNGVSSDFSVTTRSIVTEVDAFSFVDETDVPLDSVLTSASVALVGPDEGATISIDGGTAETTNDNGSTWDNSDKAYVSGQTFVRAISSSSENTSTVTNNLVTINGTSDTYTITTTNIPADSTPNQFTFTDVTGAEPDTPYENIQDITGVDEGQELTVTGGHLSNDGSTWVTTLNYSGGNTQVRAQVTSSSLYTTASNVVVTVNGVSDTFNTTTRAIIAVVNAFTYTNQGNVSLDTVIYSDPVEILGPEEGAPLFLMAGTAEISVDGGSNWSNSLQFYVVGQSFIRAYVTSSASNSTLTETTTTLNGTPSTFSVTTESAGSDDFTSITLDSQRLSGPAPLAIQFNAIDTQHSDSNIDTFHDVGYRFDFDDVGSGNWPDGESKEYEVGAPIATHVYETVGDHDVIVKARDASGNEITDTITITVTDPDTVYATTDTVVVSTGSDFTGEPTGAQQVANITDWSQLPNGGVENGKRYLLKRGDNFLSLGPLVLQDRSDWVVSSFGPGSVKPIVTEVVVDRNSNNTPDYQNGIIWDLDLIAVKQNWWFYNLLVYQCELAAEAAHVIFSRDMHSVGLQYFNGPLDEVHHSLGMFIVETDIDSELPAASGTIEGTAGTGDDHCVTVNAVRNFSVIGCTITGSKQHNLRIGTAYLADYGHNIIEGITADQGGRHGMKLNGQGFSAWTDTPIPDGVAANYIGTACQYVRIHHNDIGHATSNEAYQLQIAPENNDVPANDSGLQDIIIEDNTFVVNNGLQYKRDLFAVGRRINERRNSKQYEWGGISDPDWTTGYNAGWHGPYYSDDASNPLMMDEADSDAINEHEYISWQQQAPMPTPSV